MNHPDYAAIQALNWSTVKLLETSPLLYRRRVDVPEEDKEAYVLGRALHAAVLEPVLFASAYCGQPNFGDGRTTAAKERKVRWEAEEKPAGAEVLKLADYHAIVRAADAVHAHRVARDLLRGGRAEEVVTWTDPETGLACKARLDYITPTGVRELKSARRVGRRFASDAAGYLYHGQCAFYHDGGITAGALPADAERPCIVAVELEEPFDVACYRLTEVDMGAGRALVRSCLRRFVECQAADVWPGCAPDMMDLNLPGWAPGMALTEAPAVEEAF